MNVYKQITRLLLLFVDIRDVDTFCVDFSNIDGSIRRRRVDNRPHQASRKESDSAFNSQSSNRSSSCGSTDSFQSQRQRAVALHRACAPNLQRQYILFLPYEAMLARYMLLLCVCLSISLLCLSVCLSVCLCVFVCVSDTHCTIVSKWLNIRTTQTMPYDSPETLVFPC